MHPGLALESGEVGRRGETNRVEANRWQDFVSDEGRHRFTIDRVRPSVHERVTDRPEMPMSRGFLDASVRGRLHVDVPLHAAGGATDRLIHG